MSLAPRETYRGNVPVRRWDVPRGIVVRKYREKEGDEEGEGGEELSKEIEEKKVPN